MDTNLEAIISQQREEDNRKNTLSYQYYSDKLLEIGEESQQRRFLRKNSKQLVFRKDLDSEVLAKDGEMTQIRISPELSVVWEKIKRERDPVVCEQITRELLARTPEKGGCQIVEIEKLRAALNEMAQNEERDTLTWMWYASSENGVELHPGLIDKKDPVPLTLGDDCVHALMAGRTGAGKSVALHAIITSLMQEYAPWELNINLADFKIVELSKYGNGRYKAPHVVKIAATDSMEYVLSVMYDMYSNMDIRQKVFAALRVQKLSEFRRKFGVVLPREILIVDEFQQMYEMATPKQIGMIDRLIKMITKLGRATGYHLFFTSQSMTGTVSYDTLANFKLRLCLAADEDISNRVLGNKAAAELTGIKGKGYLISNGEGGAKEYNREYQVPLLVEKEDNSGDLSKIIELCAKLADQVAYKKDLDHYKEDFHRQFTGTRDSFDKDLNQFLINSEKVIARNEEVDFYLLLGDSCVYAKNPQKKTSLEYAAIKYGDRKNIVCIGDSVQQRAYLANLLQLQYCAPERNRNYIVNADALVRELMISVEKFEEMPMKGLTDWIRNSIRSRMLFWELIQYPAKEQTRQKMNDIAGKYYGNEEWVKEVEEKTWNNYLRYGGQEGRGGFRFKNMHRTTIWINGFHMMTDVMDEWDRRQTDNMKVSDILKVCTNLGVRFIFIGTKIGEMPPAIQKCMGYYLIMSDNPDNYLKAGMEQNKSYRDDIIRFRAVNDVLNQQKPGLYVLGQDEKIVKTYVTEDVDEEAVETELFQGIGS